MTAPDHVPVLADELLDALDPRAGETVVDGTFGAGGHARLIAERLGTDGTLVAVDRDPTAIARFEAFAAEVPCRTRFVHAGFAEGFRLLGEEGLVADALLVDLGMSSMQIDDRKRGFSYVADAPLDMRMDTTQGLTAAEIVATWDERALKGIFREFGDERYAGPIARAIVRERGRREIATTAQLVDVVTAAVPAPARFAGGHPAKRVFQAIRIAVNDEYGQIDAGLPAAWELLRVGGRFAGISFHSGEDRRVKRFLAQRAQGCICPPDFPVCACGRTPEAELLTRGGFTPGADELAANPRSASARLRAARKIQEGPTA